MIQKKKLEVLSFLIPGRQRVIIIINYYYLIIFYNQLTNELISDRYYY